LLAKTKCGVGWHRTNDLRIKYPLLSLMVFYFHIYLGATHFHMILNFINAQYQ
jgi:hypothetical protein